MQVIYLSGPMSGIEELNFPHFNEVAAELRAKGYTVINPAEIDQPDKTWEACMKRDIAELMKADTLALLDGWQKSAGAGLEVVIAAALKIEIVSAYSLEAIAIDVKVAINEQKEGVIT
jgi:nucleoside 2-deoxyribosyltransferase